MTEINPGVRGRYEPWYYRYVRQRGRRGRNLHPECPAWVLAEVAG